MLDRKDGIVLESRPSRSDDRLARAHRLDGGQAVPFAAACGGKSRGKTKEIRHLGGRIELRNRGDMARSFPGPRDPIPQDLPVALRVARDVRLDDEEGGVLFGEGPSKRPDE